MKIGRTIAAAFAVAILSAPASAALRMATISGGTYSQEDASHIFPGDLGGNYTASFIFDTTRGTRTTTSDLDQLEGVGANSPLLLATLTVNGVTKVIPITGYSAIAVAADYFSVGFYNGAASSDPHGNTAIGMYGADLPYPWSVGFRRTLDDDFVYVNTSSCFETCGGFTLVGEHGYAAATIGTGALTLSAAPSPEPGTWALMLTGFAVAGAHLRARSGRVGLAR